MASPYRHKWMGHAWACDGSAMVRRDAPLPVGPGVEIEWDDYRSEIPKGWYRTARAWIDAPGEPVGETLIQQRYRELLLAADRLDRVVVLRDGVPKLVSVIRAWRGGELIALVTEYLATDEWAVWVHDLPGAA